MQDTTENQNQIVSSLSLRAWELVLFNRGSSVSPPCWVTAPPSSRACSTVVERVRVTENQNQIVSSLSLRACKLGLSSLRT